MPLKVRYQREMSRNYLILEAPGSGEENEFERRMLEENAIAGLLPFRENPGESGLEYYYEITSRQPFSRIMESRKLRFSDIRALVPGILETMERIGDYLLPESCLLLDPEYIYVDPDTLEVRLCLVPGLETDVPAAMSSLLGQIMGQVDHQDPAGVMVAYNLYEKSLRDNFGAQDFLACFGECGDRIFTASRDSGKERRAVPGEENTGVSGYPRSCEDRSIPPESRVLTSASAADRVQGKESFGRPDARSPGRNRQDLRKAAAGVAAFLATEGLLWYLCEPEIFRIAGSVLLAAAIIGSLIFFFYQKRHSAEEERFSSEPKRTMPKAPIPGSPSPVDSTDTWSFRPESTREYQARMEKERAEQMVQSRAEGTVLLTDLPDTAETIAVLRPVDSGRQEIRISYSPFVIGKHRDLTDYCLDSPAVSRLHAKIEIDGESASVTDLNSTNGTTLNGRKLEANETAPLSEGDLLCLADVGFRFRRVRRG